MNVKDMQKNVMISSGSEKAKVIMKELILIFDMRKRKFQETTGLEHE